MRNVNKPLKNIFYSFFGQLVIILLGILLPRILIISYGSEVNGLLSTVTQIFTYVALLEAGIGNAATNALYKIKIESERKRASEILTATKYTYLKFSMYYILCAFAAAIIFPLVAKTSIDRNTVFWVVLIQGFSSVLNFVFSASYSAVFIADGKNYLSSNINTVIRVLTYIVKIALAYYGLNVIVIQFSFLAVEVLKQIIFYIYFKKNYPFIEISKKNYKPGILQEKNAFLVHEISGTIFSSTDLIVLSVFCSMTSASVYSVYSLIYTSLGNLISNVNRSLEYILGQTFNTNREKYEEIHDAYNSIYITIVFAIYNVAMLLTPSFMGIYTKNFQDAVYVDKWLPILFTTINLMSASRAVSARLITVAGHAQNTQYRSILEAIINIVSSLILVQIFGIYGVLLGTIIALIYRMNDIIIYSEKIILKRSPYKTYKVILTNTVVFLLITLIYTRMIDLQVNNYFEFGITGIALSVIIGFLYILVWIILNRKKLFLLKKVMKK